MDSGFLCSVAQLNLFVAYYTFRIAESFAKIYVLFHERLVILRMTICKSVDCYKM